MSSRNNHPDPESKFAPTTVEEPEAGGGLSPSVASDSKGEPLGQDADSPGELNRKLLEELQLHQAELHQQNEELREAYAAQEKNRSRYRQLYQHAPVGYLVISKEGVITEVNTTFAKMIGGDAVHLRHKPLTNYIHPDHRKLFLSRIRTLYKQPQNKVLELRLQPVDNRDPIYVSLAASDAAAAEPGELFLAITDITERVHAQQQVHEYSQFIRDILDSISSNICVIEADGRIIMVNNSWSQFTLENGGDSQFTGVGANYFEVIERTTGEEREQALAFGEGIRAVIAGRAHEFSLEYPCHSPSLQRWFVGRATPLNDEGEAKAVIIHTNVTERKRLEQLKLKLQAEVSQLAKADSLSRLAGAMAHKFNNLIAVILGNLEMGMDSLPKGGDGVLYFKEALQAGWRASELGGLMLTYLGHNLDEMEDHSLSELCRSLLPPLLADLPANLQVQFDFPVPGPKINCSPKLLQQLFANVLTNAREALVGTPQPTISLSVDTVPAKAVSTEHRHPADWQIDRPYYACLSIDDNGCGIGPESIDKIFDPFYTTGMTGRGMGLAVVIGILRTHGGGIAVTSTPGKGSTFTIYFPLVCEVDTSSSDA